jgi:predicted transcriptional regulator
MNLENKEKIILAISSFPGINLRGLKRMLGLSLSTVRYHTEKLEKDRSIFSVIRGNRKLYFQSEPTEDVVKLSLIMLNPSKRKVILLLNRIGPLSNSQISKLAKIPDSTVSETLAELFREGVVEPVFDEGRGWSLTEKFTELIDSGSITQKMLRNYIKLWEI